jgi:hypothetical protein
MMNVLMLVDLAGFRFGVATAGFHDLTTRLSRICTQWQLEASDCDNIRLLNSHRPFRIVMANLLPLIFFRSVYTQVRV